MTDKAYDTVGRSYDLQIRHALALSQEDAHCLAVALSAHVASYGDLSNVHPNSHVGQAARLLHIVRKMSLGHRGYGANAVNADGRVDGGRLPQLALEREYPKAVEYMGRK